ncbi:MAG: carboxylesterase family protein [Sphaerochaetaceae bacterium]|nr:carboxylesterase family protein [Sphaerochaetaceae bacterium]
MKLVIRIEDVLVSLVAALGYGLGYGIAQSYGCSIILCLVACIIGGTIFRLIANALIKTKWAEKSKRSKATIILVIVFIFGAISIIIWKFLHHSIFGDLGSELILGTVGLTVVSFVISLIRNGIKERNMKARFNDGSEGHTMTDKERDYMESMKGKNREIKGRYDENLAVKTENGVFVGTKSWGVQQFLGIPYAKPPVRDLRWKLPQKPEPSDKVWEAYYFGPSAVQIDDQTISLSAFTQSEDCLTLNIWRSNKKSSDDELKPVLMYIHGGNLAFGGSAEPLYNGYNFVKTYPHVIVVSINYRIGLFGFISNFDTDVPEEFKDSNNLGIHDQIMALQWVHDNIRAFGGDPDNIMLAGDTMAASCIKIISTLEQAKGLFRRALLLSSITSAIDSSSQIPRVGFKDLMEKFGVSSVEELLKIPTSKLKLFQNEKINDVWYLPYRDGRLIKKNINQAILDGDTGDIEFLFCVPANEMSSWITVGSEKNMLIWAKATIDDIKASIKGKVEEDRFNDVLEYYLKTEKKEDDAYRNTLEFWLYRYDTLVNSLDLAAQGKPVKLFFWDIDSPIVKLGGNSMSATGALLGNNLLLEDLGHLVSSLIKNVFQGLIYNIIANNKAELAYDEVKGVNKLVWKDFTGEKPYVLYIGNDKIEVDRRVLKKDFQILKKWYSIEEEIEGES